MASARPPRFDSSGTKRRDDTEELLVFGYSCKLFRDDEKAQFIDQGKHLIPWMGDDSLKIDRYDVRGTAYDLRPLEPLGGGASDALWSTLSDAERKVEQLCDEERYRALYHNEAEEALYQEEELKRLHQALDPQNSYGQVAYSYDTETEQDASMPSNKEPSEAVDEEDEPFIPPQDLDIPVGMVLPERSKLNAIIEKTAAFINAQGPQMEIILKMKQANNPQFSFLSFDCPLHAYYRHLLVAIKTGRYKTREERKQLEENDSENSEHYLHPSLATATKPVELAPSIPSISYKPSADCAYSMLVNKIKDRLSKLSDENAPASPGDELGQDENSVATNQSIIAPPPDILVIVDKMASYVIKNGRDFESVVRSKGDDRFAFLESGHKYHPYYEHKVRVYQGLEAPINFSQRASASNTPGTQKPGQVSIVKKQSPGKKQRPILLPGYEYSDNSSDTDEDESDSTTADSKGKPKLAPVCFSIKKPKEAEILKESKSALPLEEESSEGEGDCSEEAPLKQTPEPTPIDPEPGPEVPLTVANPEQEMKRLQQLLKEKERQLREQESLKKLTVSHCEDIFQIEKPESPSMSTSCSPPLVVTPAVSQPVVQVVKEPETPCDVNERNDSCEEIKVIEESLPCKISDDQKHTALSSLNTEEFLNEISETDVIDLTEDTPKVSDTMRLERKRRAAAFLSRLQKGRHSSKNGTVRPTSESDALSRHSSPSPTRLKLEKLDSTLPSFHEASIPRTSLMARLAASAQLPRKPISEKKRSGKEKSRSSTQQKDSPMKSTKVREDKPYYRQRIRKKKDYSSTSESEEERSRSRSRSVSYSRSPSKRHQGDDSDSELRSHRHYKESKSGYRKKQGTTESAEPSRDHSRLHRRHGEERRSHSYSHSHSQSHGRSGVQGRSRGHIHDHSHNKRTEIQIIDSDSSN